jgi:hypothetical protein
MRTTNNRRRFLRNRNEHQHSDEHVNRNYPGEFAHRYSENREGDQYVPGDWRKDEWEEWDEWDEWDENPGENIDYNRSYGHPQGGEWMRDRQQESPQRQHEFRARNTRFRNRLRGYRNHIIDTNVNYDRDDLNRERGSIDEHLGRGRRDPRYDNW